MIHFEIPKNQSSILKVIGVGGGGGNAVNYMHSLGLEGIDFVVCNTDSQALSQSPVANKIQLGPHLTQGLGAGANPEVGMKASEESMDDIAKILKVNTKMAFITAGMGGGTGTGGAPVVAKICRDLGILTVGIVTMPFSYEGRRRMKQAQEGIDRMREHVDTIVVVSNDKLRQQFGNLPFTQAFAKADDVLATAAKCITDVITSTGQVNTDFADVSTVMSNGGVAILGSASAEGENRAEIAVEQALSSPLLNDSDISGARWILLNVNSAQGDSEHNLDELEIIQAYVQQQAGDNCDVILGMGYDQNLGDKISVTVIATGFTYKDVKTDVPAAAAKKDDRQKLTLSLADTTPAVAEPVAAAPVVVESPIDPLAPRLVEERPAAAPAGISAVGSFLLQIKQKQDTVANQPAVAAQEESMEVVMKEVATAAPAAEERPSYLHRMSAEDLEEKQRFEEQKRALEERAERLRKLSFNIKGSDNTDDMENVPAYMRQGKNIAEKDGSASDTYLSGYSVGTNNGGGNQFGAQSTIQTINTFLEGKKPD